MVRRFRWRRRRDAELTSPRFSDIDTRFPRSLPEIYRLNRYVAERIRRTFGKVPVVTSFGNNGQSAPTIRLTMR